MICLDGLRIPGPNRIFFLHHRIQYTILCGAHDAVPGSRPFHGGNMSQQVTITAAHWVYLAGVMAVLLTMVMRARVVVPCIIATFAVALVWTRSPVSARGSIFNASFVAAKELFNIFLVIALITSLLNALKSLRSDVLMVQPFRTVMTNGHTAFFVLSAVTYVISLFFWPTPAVPLVSAVLLPAAIIAGLPPLAGAMAIAIAGQGMALSSDYVIGVAPGISAKAAGAAISAAAVADRALVLSLITGGVALVLAYFSIRKLIRPGSEALLTRWQNQSSNGELERLEAVGSFDKAEIARSTGASYEEPLAIDAQLRTHHSLIDKRRAVWSKLFAVLTPVGFAAVIAVMVLPKLGAASGLPELKGGDAAALVGGMGAALMILATLAAEGPRRGLDVCADHITDGFVFAFKAMRSVLPIAGFFFMGAGGDLAAGVLNVPVAEAPPLLFNLIQNAQEWIPHNHVLVAFWIKLN